MVEVNELEFKIWRKQNDFDYCEWSIVGASVRFIKDETEVAVENYVTHKYFLSKEALNLL